MSTKLFASFFVFQIVSSYFLSENWLTYIESSTYCRNYCQSNLSSIRNNKSYFQLIYIIQNSIDTQQEFWNISQFDKTKVWFGLDQIDSATFAFQDNTPFDSFGANLSGGVYPVN